MKKLRWVMMGLIVLFIIQGAMAQDSSSSEEAVMLTSSDINGVKQDSNGQILLSDLLTTLEQHFDVTFLYKDEVMVHKYVGRDEIKIDKKTGQDLYKILEKLGISFQRIDEQTYVLLDKAFSLQAVQVQEEISGTVTDAQSGETLPGVNVMVKGTTTGTSTVSDGTFKLTVESLQDTLIFSFVGYMKQEVPISGRTKINVTLQMQAISGEELVVVGYGTQEKTSLTSAVSAIKGEKISTIPITSMSNSLGGRMSGVIVKQGSGEPGRDDSNIFIRGISTTGSTNPLVIVDGIPRDFQQLDPNNIESISVLKDAAAVAPYGVAGANGVILVTTKRGKAGAPSITYDGYMGVQSPTVLPEYVNSYEFAILKNRVAENEGREVPYNDYALERLQDGTEPDLYPNQDIHDLTIDKNAPLTSHSLGLGGGTEYIQYYLGLGYQYQQGMWPTTNKNKYNLNLNIDIQPTEHTNIALSLSGLVLDANYPNVSRPVRGEGTTGRIMELMGYAHFERAGPYVLSNGMYGAFVMAALYESGYQDDNTTSINSKIRIDQDIPFIEGLSLNGTIAYDPSFYNMKQWKLPLRLGSVDQSQDPYVITESFFGPTKPSLTQINSQSNQFTYQAGFEYMNSFKSHNFNLLGVFEAITGDSWRSQIERKNYNLYVDEINMGSSSSSDLSTSGSSSQKAQVGLLYRLNYDFEGKYLFETSGRYDGHYYFSPGNRYGFFPAFSIGWLISEENFIKDSFSWLSNLKLRASYGEVGALAGGPFQYMSLYGVSGPGYVFGGDATQIIYEQAESNPNITWERANKTDIGIELSLWENKINIEADYFYEKRSNMLVFPNVVTPLEYGIGLSQVNAGVMENRGIDLLGRFNHYINPDLQISLNGTFTFARNKVLEIFESETTFNNPNRRRTGRPLGTQFGYKAIGYFQLEDFDSEGNINSNIAKQPWGEVHPGDIRYEDINGDGQISEDDIVVIGDPNQSPEILYGISTDMQFKGWSLNVLFQGAAKTSLYYEGDMIRAFHNGMNAYKENLDHWTPENPNAKHPRITGSPTTNNSQRSSFWMRDASYLRLKNATLSYDIPSRFLNHINIQNARIYVSGQNLLTWTDMKYYDPESTRWSYPQQRVMSLGLNLNF